MRLSRPDLIAAENAAGEVRPFRLTDMPEWGEWLMGRLETRFPGQGMRSWHTKILSAMAGNGFHFIRNDRAVLLVESYRRFLDGGLVCMEIFALSRDAVMERERGDLFIPNADPMERPVVLLYRHAREWCKSQKASRFFVGQCSDIDSPLRIKELMKPGAVECGWISVRTQ